MARRSGRFLPRRFYERATETVAPELVGCLLVSNVRGVVTAGRIVEVEAYTGPEDPACHSVGWRRTQRTEAMYGAPGSAYVYRSYGLHWCFNVVTERVGFPAAVLIRALEPIDGVDVMSKRRRQADPRLLCSGPGRLCQALGITGAHNGRELKNGVLRVEQANPSQRIQLDRGPRIGISTAQDWPLRFFERSSHWLSRRG